MFRRMPGMEADGGRLSSGVLAGGVGMLMMAAVKSCSPQFSFRLSAWAFRLDRLRERQTHTYTYFLEALRSKVHLSFSHKLCGFFNLVLIYILTKFSENQQKKNYN